MKNTSVGVGIVMQPFEYSLCMFSFRVDNVQSHLTIDGQQWLFTDDFSSIVLGQ
jgi:hypothetical protein